MAYHGTRNCSEGVWTQLTADDATKITFQNAGPSGVQLVATSGAVAPTDLDGSVRCIPGASELGIAPGDISPGVTGAARVWAYATEGSANMVVSHD